MDTPARWATPLTLVALASFLPLASIPASGSPLPQNAAAVRATDDAVKLIQENRVQEALETLDRAIDADDEHWEAHYQRGSESHGVIITMTVTLTCISQLRIRYTPTTVMVPFLLGPL